MFIVIALVSICLVIGATCKYSDELDEVMYNNETNESW